jgi:hypothetical protein
MPNPTDRVTCTQCKNQSEFQSGFLTEAQKNNYKCEACLAHPVVENQVTHRESTEGGKRLLTEDLPNAS